MTTDQSWQISLHPCFVNSNISISSPIYCVIIIIVFVNSQPHPTDLQTQAVALLVSKVASLSVLCDSIRSNLSSKLFLLCWCISSLAAYQILICPYIASNTLMTINHNLHDLSALRLVAFSLGQFVQNPSQSYMLIYLQSLYDH